jgi:hypothetical protein
MEAQNEPKPKRKFVMTPERRAKLMANLEKARLAPKEKVYRKTAKRYAANLNNLGIANAMRRQEREILSAKMEGLFPPPAAPPPPLPRLQPSPGDPPRRMPPSFFLDPFDEATRQIGKRLHKVHAAVRGEGRRIMRLLTAALDRSRKGSQPLSVEEAKNLVGQLLQCLDGARVSEAARRLNEKIGRLLGKMIEVRYGVEPGAVPVEVWLEQLREDRRARAAAARQRRAARQGRGAKSAAAAEELRKGHLGTPGDRAEVRAEAGAAVEAGGGNENAAEGGWQRKEPSKVSVPELPETWEEFQGLVTRALQLEDEPEVAGALAETLWNRLHLWKEREETEAQELERLFQGGAANPPESYPDPDQELRHRAYKIRLILRLDDGFLRWRDQLTARVERCFDWWVSSIPSIQGRRASRLATIPAQAPVRATSDQPINGLEDPPSAA